MISGFSSASFATALRSAGQARVTMDSMARQIATGQRVASARDDGAAFARAAQMRSDRIAQEALRTNYARLNAVFDINRAATEARLDGILYDRELALAASDPSLSTEARAALIAVDANSDVGSTAVIGATSHQQRNAAGTANFTFNSNYAANTLSILQDINGAATTYQPWADPVNPGGGSLNTAADAVLRVNNLGVEAERHRIRLMYWSGVQRAFNMADAHLERAGTRLDTAIGTLTDADLGKASAARAQAETRQQLALTTVRQAISTYGNYASGLLGNAQRSQRGIMA